ncbi:transposase [Bradyrhizobium sp. USDA 4506]
MSKDSRKDSDTNRHTPILKEFSDTLQRVEIITGTSRRRRWSADAKAAIIAESFAPGASVYAVARRHDISPSLLFLRRRQTTRAKVAARRAGDVTPGFVPVAITGCGGKLPSCEEQATIEIEVGAVRIRVGGRSTGGRCAGAGSRDGWPMIGLRPGLSIWIATQPVDSVAAWTCWRCW